MTQLESACKSILTKEMEICAATEQVPPALVLKKLQTGQAVLPKNKRHTLERPMVIGEGFSVKVNANIGTSRGYSSLEEELAKMEVAIEAGTDALMVLSTWGDLQGLRQRIVERSPVPVGSVPIYDAAVKAYSQGKRVIDFSEEDFIEMVRTHAEDGVDFMTIHAGITRRVLDCLGGLRQGATHHRYRRYIPMVSRGGAILAGWMRQNKQENPFYRHFDEILDIAKEYDVTLSLGDGLRPGAIHDATDQAQLEELFELQPLVEQAWAHGVQVMIEGPGHVPLDEIETNIRVMKKIGKGAPIFVLGPLPTDRGVGYDHIVAAVGGALAGFYGADFLCYVTPSEHVSLPGVAEVQEGVIAARIAAIIADVARHHPRALALENRMALARSHLDWEEMFATAIHPERARKYYEERPYQEEGCSMCGPFCAIRIGESLGS
ncbi:MAG: phosphomethylpyrimidine synthase ThiC [Breznakiellaceae bacterium]